ncbi:MAG: GNAT family N-acetyltransferase [Clostridium sp.]|nr:GNAT family N-acetyltransferase [Clostridium sp.]
MTARSNKIDSITYQIREIEEGDLNGLLLVKGDVSVHTERLKQQEEGRAVYIGAFINQCAVGYVLLSLDNKEDVMPYTNDEKCADMIDLLIMEPLRNYGIGSQLILACEEICREKGILCLGLDVNPEDNAKAKQLYERMGYHAVGEKHLDGIYEYMDGQGNMGIYEDWCIDMIKFL